jgi:hypothetical protein
MEVVMRKIWIAATFGLLALAGCAQAPSFSEAPPPAVPQNEARIIVYRWPEPYETLLVARLDLDGRPLGYAQNGDGFVRDVSPGEHTISIVSRVQFPGQTATVTLRPGETLYVRIASLSSWFPHFPDPLFTIRFANAITGQRDVASLPHESGWGWAHP